MNKIYLQLTPFFPTPEHFYGPYIYDQVKAIQRNSNFKVIVIKIRGIFNIERPLRDSKTYQYDGIDVYNFDTFDFPSSILPGFFHAINKRRFENFLHNVVGIDPQKISIIHSHTIYPAGALGVFLKRKYNIPCIIQHHGFDIFQENSGRILKGWLKEKNKRYTKRFFLDIINQASLNVAVSQKVLDQLLQTPGFSNPSTYVLYNGVDTMKFFKKDVEKRNDHFVIGCIANFWPLKDHMTLLKAAGLLKKKGITDLELQFIGSGPTFSACKEFIETHDLQDIVSFEKEMGHELLNDFYNSLDLFVLPSYYEAFGCVYTEAMQVGVPIIAVKGQGIEEVLHPEDRERGLIEKGDDYRLADLIEFRYNHRLRVKYDFDINTYIRDFLQFLEKTLIPTNKEESGF